VSDYLTHWSFLKKIRRSMSFFGINYYGAEWMTPQGPAQYQDLEFSDAGRAVSPQGLLVLLKKIHQTYQLPILVTENGVGDGSDQLRPAYLLEHLAAIHQAIHMGIPVQGYVHWTLSDNLEWSDGYGPKFGLVEVDRSQNLKRVPRPSFYLYQKIIRNHGFTAQERKLAWENYQKSWGATRPYWRAENGKEGRDEAYLRPTPHHDWRLKI
jgi:beta-glucosidase/6-phospho-beta-glucosidase/beta-galactosidase